MMRILMLWMHFIILFQLIGFSFPDNNTTNPAKNPFLCRQEQGRMLLELKLQLSHSDYYAPSEGCPYRPQDYYRTMFWNKSSDCCLWEGVTCDVSGRVIGLDFSCSGVFGKIHSNSTIFRLSHLQMLNLAGSIVSSNIPPEFGQLNRLTHLNLSASGFFGRIPLEFYHLSNMVLLEITPIVDPEPSTVSCDIEMLLGNMTKIEVLVLREATLSSQLPVNMSSFLTHLDLSSTGLQSILPPTIFEKPLLHILNLGGNLGLTGSFPKSFNESNVRSFRELDLSATSISGILPDSIGFMNNLEYLRLDGCQLRGPIPESIGNFTKMIEMDMSGNMLSRQVPSTISNLRQLTILDLSKNNLEGQLPDAFSDHQKLTYLKISSNNLTGLIPSSLTNMSQLKELDISSNALIGPFPSRADNGLQNLSQINLSNNLIQGMIPSWMLSLPSLTSLDLSFNRLTGHIGKFNSGSLNELDFRNNQLKIDLESFYNLTNIGSILISYNTVVTEHAREAVNVTLPGLQTLMMSSCEIKEFPNFLRYLPSVQSLDISKNGIHGLIPNWFTSMPWQGLLDLDLSTNNLTYADYLPWNQVRFLNLYSNSIRGTFSSSICNMSDLWILNLSNNKLGGRVPDCIGNMSIGFLDLRKNEFNGAIPKIVGETQLFYLGLNSNQFEGPLPRSLANSTDLEVLDLGNNEIHDTFPSWLQTLPQLKILILKSNSFHGSITPYFSNNSFSQLKIIDLSHNDFTGMLPKQLFPILQAIKNQSQASSDASYMGNSYRYSVTLSVKGTIVELTAVLNIFNFIDLSSNKFEGGIPESVTDLSALRLLNLSHNKINGSIPPALGQMTNLEQLDLSSNQLTGCIPQTLTNLTFLAVLNLSHNHLVGPIPQANQFSTFSNGSYDGNSGLCGFPLTKRCGPAPAPESSIEEEEVDDSGLMVGFTWKAVAMGYACGIVLGFILGIIMLTIGKPKWLSRFVYEEAAIYLDRRRKRGRTAAQRRRGRMAAPERR